MEESSSTQQHAMNKTTPKQEIWFRHVQNHSFPSFFLTLHKNLVEQVKSHRKPVMRSSRCVVVGIPGVQGNSIWADAERHAEIVGAGQQQTTGVPDSSVSAQTETE